MGEVFNDQLKVSGEAGDTPDMFDCYITRDIVTNDESPLTFDGCGGAKFNAQIYTVNNFYLLLLLNCYYTPLNHEMVQVYRYIALHFKTLNCNAEPLNSVLYS